MVSVFSDVNATKLIDDGYGNVVLNTNIIGKVAKFLCDYVFHIQSIRENIKTIA